MAFCFKHLNLSGKVVGLKREEELEVPYEALREGVINATAGMTISEKVFNLGFMMTELKSVTPGVSLQG